VSGASKRGWTTWLTAAADRRVVAIAPMVIDMLNMKTQLQWADKVYGKQSEEINDYTQLNLHMQMDEPAMVTLRSFVDPYSYRMRYNIPKLLLLGTNDPYWTVDSLRHYWDDLPEPKLIDQTPNAGHDLGDGKQAVAALAAFYQMVADRQPLPAMNWNIKDSPAGSSVSLTLSQPAKRVVLWTADSKDRDFRDEKWSSRPVETTEGGKAAAAEVAKPESGFRAFLLEATLASPTGQDYQLSSEARVTPDSIR
jgi:PhoPQ-activated pathogenicity-related protein